MFRRPHFDLPEEHSHSSQDVVSPLTITDADHFHSPSKSSTLAVPDRSKQGTYLPGSINSKSKSSPKRDSPTHPPSRNSGRTNASTQSNIREVAPWIDFDVDLSLPPPIQLPITQEQIISQSSAEGPSKQMTPVGSFIQMFQQSSRDSPPLPSHRYRRKSGDLKGLAGLLRSGSPSKTQDTTKSALIRSRNPMAKLFDGAASIEDRFQICDTTPLPSRASSFDIRRATPTRDRRVRRASSSDGTMRLHSPTPVRPFSPDMPLTMRRRGALCTNSDDDGGLTFPRFSYTLPIAPLLLTPTAATEDPFDEAALMRSPSDLLVSLKKFMTRPLSTTPVSSTCGSPRTSKVTVDGSVELSAQEEPTRVRSASKDKDVQIVFNNPFRRESSPLIKTRAFRKRESSGVAPDEVG